MSEKERTLEVEQHFAALKLIDLLYAKGLVNQATYDNIRSHEGETAKPGWVSRETKDKNE